MTTAEMTNRAAKAARLAAQLVAHGADLAAVEQLPDAGWSMVAELAGTQVPSDLTKAAVIGILRQHEAAKADPFASFTLDQSRTGATRLNGGL